MFMKPSALLGPEETAAIVKTKLAWILRAARPERIYVFGSAARGEMNEASDVDLAVVFRTEAEYRSARKAILCRPRDDAWPQDILFFVADEFDQKALVGGVCMIIAEEGRLLYSDDREFTA
jgi:predicted nucleotidyltransferase